MRIALCLALLFSEVGPAPGQETIAAYCPQTAKLSENPTDQWFEGMIGASRARMYIRRGGQAIVGLYYDLSDWKPVLLGGQWTREGNVRMTASPATQDSVPVIIVSGVMSSTGDFTGSVVSSDGMLSPQQSVAMRQVPKPSCSGGGPWQTFTSPKWPITFSYPASWHVEIAEADVPTSTSNEKLVLACPDPMTLAYNMTIEFSPEEMSDGNRVSDFIRFGGGPWMYGCDSDNRESCHKPVVTHKSGMSILRADEVEFRSYCVDGDYVGQGEGHRFMLSFDGQWIQFYGSGPPSNIMDRVLSTIQIRK